MIELEDDIFYKEYKIFFDSVIDYLIIKNNIKENTLNTHKEIISFALERLSRKYQIKYTCNKSKMNAKKISKDELFSKAYTNLFLNPPFGKPCIKDYSHISFKKNIKKEDYTIEDFKYINNLLFPKGIENLDIYEWNPNFSNYFDEGNEWWGSKCISIYDKNNNRYVVVLVSATD